MSRFDTVLAALRSLTATGILPGMKQCLVPAMSAAILLGVASDLHAQGRVFYDDFEAGHANKWSA